MESDKYNILENEYTKNALKNLETQVRKIKENYSIDGTPLNIYYKKKIETPPSPYN